MKERNVETKMERHKKRERGGKLHFVLFRLNKHILSHRVSRVREERGGEEKSSFFP